MSNDKVLPFLNFGISIKGDFFGYVEAQTPQQAYIRGCVKYRIDGRGWEINGQEMDITTTNELMGRVFPNPTLKTKQGGGDDPK